MAEFITVGSSGAFQLEAPANQGLRVTHEGGQTVFYSTSPRVSTLTFDGSLTTGGAFQFTGKRFFITQAGTGTQGSSASLRLDPIPLVGESVTAQYGLNLMDYGAVGDGIANDTTAIQDWADALVSSGGVGLVPTGTYKHTAISFQNSRTNAIVIRGTGAGDGGTTTATFAYSGGASSGTAWNLQSTHTITFEDVALTYTNAGYDGNLVDMTHAASAVDTTGINFLRCYLGGSSASVTGARSCCLIEQAIICSWRDCTFRYAQNGVYGSQTTYSIRHTIDNCSFPVNGMTVCCIRNPDESWTISNNTIEALASGAAGGIQGDAGIVSYGLNITGNWFGDLSSPTSGYWIVLNGEARGLTVTGNRFQTNGAAADQCLRMQAGGTYMAAGNRFEGLRGIVNEVGTYYATIVGNDFNGCTNPFSNAGSTWSGTMLGNANLADSIRPFTADTGAQATTAATTTTPYGFTTQAQADAIATHLNDIRSCLRNHGLMS